MKTLSIAEALAVLLVEDRVYTDNGMTGVRAGEWRFTDFKERVRFMTHDQLVESVSAGITVLQIPEN